MTELQSRARIPGNSPQVKAGETGHEQWLLALRLPGRGEYLRALDNAVRSTVSGEQTSEEALGEVAQAWREITERLGVDTQRRAYLHSLGLW